MNTTVFVASMLVGALTVVALEWRDRRTRRSIDELRERGVVETALAVITQVRGGRDQLVVELADGTKTTVALGSLTRPRPTTALKVRVLRTSDTVRAELVDAPQRTMGRALSISVGVCSLLLGLVLALLT